MKRKAKSSFVYLGVLLIAVMLTACNNPQCTVPTSLHATIEGMRTFCEALDGDTHFIGSGIEAAYGIDYDNLGCKNCHDSSKASEPDDDPCNNCHTDLVNYEDEIENETCLGCHSRQGKEAALEITDVHASNTETDECTDCHSLKEMHGDLAGVQNPYQSMWDPGATDTTCMSSGCHDEISVTEHDSTHGGKLDCSACHLQTVISCYNCHFDTFMDSGEKKAKGALKDWVFLVNDESGKVRTGSFQSLVYQDESFIVFAPFHSHSVAAKEETRTCSECHNSEAIQELTADGKITVTEWDEATSTLTQTQGVIPVVDGKMEFAYLNYDSASDSWSLVGTTTDNTQYGYCTPLTDAQITKLKMDLPALEQHIIDNQLMDEATLEKLEIK
ncbi:MAG: hypothetical protein JRF49_04990 [Deltaproteobacteria bacterium]|nr:hypothetical protein [Deltaproteobacteria bacterium]